MDHPELSACPVCGGTLKLRNTFFGTRPCRSSYHYQCRSGAAKLFRCERARLVTLGRTPPFADGQIAAIAHTHQLILVTFNRADYADFSDLMIEDWRV
jgi:hypothetical protein